MATIKDVAQAFAAGKPAKCHNAYSDGTCYFLHGHLIAYRYTDGGVKGYWCGWYTNTPANHLKHIGQALGRYGYTGRAQARDEGIQEFLF